MHQKKIVEAVDVLKDWPKCQQVKALINYEYSYRLLVGSYRIFFDVIDLLRIITIEEVKKRDEKTY